MLREKIENIHTAIRALMHAWHTEYSIKVQLFSTIALSVCGLYLGLTVEEWRILLVTFGVVLGVELINTALENLCDALHPDYDEQIGLVKDLAAAASFVVGLAAVYVSATIFIPHLFF